MISVITATGNHLHELRRLLALDAPARVIMGGRAQG
jgi:hypothetical protein